MKKFRSRLGPAIAGTPNTLDMTCADTQAGVGVCGANMYQSIFALAASGNRSSDAANAHAFIFIFQSPFTRSAILHRKPSNLLVDNPCQECADTPPVVTHRYLSIVNEYIKNFIICSGPQAPFTEQKNHSALTCRGVMRHSETTQSGKNACKVSPELARFLVMPVCICYCFVILLGPAEYKSQGRVIACTTDPRSPQ